MLVVCDDGRRDGEAIRLRADRFIIGRTGGDLRLPHDGRISSRHVEIARRLVDGRLRWVVADLRSRNGLFVRVSRASLADGVEFLVGRGRYRFEAPRGGADEVRPGRTRGMDEAPEAPALTELLDDGLGDRVRLVGEESWIGSARSCAIARPDDSFCEPRHARIHRSPRGRWRVEHAAALNGLWLRVEQVVAERSIHFQIGEQRFRLKV